MGNTLSAVKKRELSQEEKRECAALKRIFEQKKQDLGINQQTIADALGDATQGAVSHYLTGRNPLNLRAANVFANTLGVPISDFSPRLARERLNYVTKVDGESENGLPLLKVPVVCWSMALKVFDSPGKPSRSDITEWRLSPFDSSARAICLPVEGSSMAPDYREGELILVDPAETPRHGDDVVAKTVEGRLVFRNLQITSEGCFLRARNDDFPQRIVEIPDLSHVLGVVLGSWMDRRPPAK